MIGVIRVIRVRKGRDLVLLLQEQQARHGILACPPVSYPATLPYRTLPCPTLPYLPHSTLPYLPFSTLLYPVPLPALPCPTLPALLYPTLPYLPHSTLPSTTAPPSLTRHTPDGPCDEEG